MSELNGKEHNPDVTALQDAQTRLAQAAMEQGMRLEGAAFSAYINGLLQSARLSAVVKFLLFQNPAFEEMLTAYTVDELNENIIPKLIAAKAPTVQPASSLIVGRH